MSSLSLSHTHLLRVCISGSFPHLRYALNCALDSFPARQQRKSSGIGTGSWTVWVVLKDVWVAGILGEDPMSVPVGVTLINHILSAGCVEDYSPQLWTLQDGDRTLCAAAHFILRLKARHREVGGVRLDPIERSTSGARCREDQVLETYLEVKTFQ